jgi:outer membrane protein
MIERILVFLFLIAPGLAASGLAQVSEVLEGYIRAGLTGNLALQQQEIGLRTSAETVRQSRARLYPTLQFNASYTRAAGGRSIEFPIGDLLNPVYTTLNQITQSNGFPQLENETIRFLPDNFQETNITFAYPLFNSALRYNRRLQDQLYQSESARKSAFEHELRYHITEAYLRYLQTLEAEKIWVDARSVLTELRRFNESLVRNNVATRDVVSTADYELSKAENEIIRLRGAQNNARALVNYLINRDLQTEVIADTMLLKRIPPDYSLEALLQEAQSNRREFDALRAGLAASETAVKIADAGRTLPEAYIGGEFGFQGFGYSFGGDQVYALAQVGITYDLFAGGLRQSKVQEARLGSEKLQVQYGEARQQIALQVTQAWNDFTAARQAWQTTQSGLQSAEATFRIVRNKYEARQTLLIEYLEAQNRVTTARLQVVLAWTEVLISEAALLRAAGAD